MKTEWDYTDLADAYLKRPDYASAAIDQLLQTTKVKKGDKVCDVGAGVAHLTLELARRGLVVSAVEPNDAMRANGKKRTAHLTNVTWSEGTGEVTGQLSKVFRLVTFGSSFNVCDRERALRETIRILIPRGWFACMWNHRGLDDPIQQKIEGIIAAHIPNYSYGTRREDQTAVINASGLFDLVHTVEGDVTHRQSTAECIEAWRSHATLHRQAGEAFPKIINEIETYLLGLKQETIEIPYTTRIWFAQARE